MTERVRRHQADRWKQKQKEASEWYDLHDNDDGITIHSLIFVGGLLMAVGILGAMSMIINIPMRLKHYIGREF